MALGSKTYTCEQCNKDFPYKKDSKNRFCSYQCYWNSMKGVKPKNTEGLEFGRGWNRGKYKDQITYNSVHKHLQRNYIKTGICEFCGNEETTQFASKNGEYTRDINDYYELCISCHVLKDKANPLQPDWESNHAIYG